MDDHRQRVIVASLQLRKAENENFCYFVPVSKVPLIPNG